MFGFFSAALYYDVLYVRFGYLAANSAAMPAILFLSLLWPTFLMGMALPLLARALTFDADGAARVIGTLYGANTFGAAMGALLTTWWLIPQMGLAGSLRLSAWLNVIVAVAGVPLAIRFGQLSRGAVRSAHPAAAVAMSGLDIHLSFRTWAGLYGLSGFLALSLELIWFRIFGVMMKSSSFTFGTLLAVYLAGLGLGAAAGSRLARSSRRPARTFLFLQTAIGIYAGLSVIALLALLKAPASAGWLSRYLGEYEAMNVRRALTRFDGEFLQLFFVIPIALIGPPTFLMGLGFPLLQKVVQTDLGRLGFRTGALMMSNIVGSTLGTVATGWLGLRLFGTAASLKAVVAASSVFALVGLSTRGPEVGPVAPRGRVGRHHARSRDAGRRCVMGTPSQHQAGVRRPGRGRIRGVAAEAVGQRIGSGRNRVCGRSRPKRASIRRHPYPPRRPSGVRPPGSP